MYIPTDDEMEALINEAEIQILEWRHTPNTSRQFKESSLWGGTQGDGSGRLVKTLVLEGGEAKGVIVADYYSGVVIAFDKGFFNMRIWRIGVN